MGKDIVRACMNHSDSSHNHSVRNKTLVFTDETKQRANTNSYECKIKTQMLPIKNKTNMSTNEAIHAVRYVHVSRFFRSLSPSRLANVPCSWWVFLATVATKSGTTNVVENRFWRVYASGSNCRREYYSDVLHAFIVFILVVTWGATTSSCENHSSHDVFHDYACVDCFRSAFGLRTQWEDRYDIFVRTAAQLFILCDCLLCSSAMMDIPWIK
jgi:hypothetical protein